MTQSPSCLACFLSVAVLVCHALDQGWERQSPPPTRTLPQPTMDKGPLRGGVTSMPGHPWSLDGRWARSLSTPSFLLMHCAAAGLGQPPPCPLQSVCTHSTLPLPRPPSRCRECQHSLTVKEEGIGKGSGPWVAEAASSHWVGLGSWR